MHGIDSGKCANSLFSRVIYKLGDGYHGTLVTYREVFFHFMTEIILGFANVY